MLRVAGCRLTPYDLPAYPAYRQAGAGRRLTIYEDLGTSIRLYNDFESLLCDTFPIPHAKPELGTLIIEITITVC